MGSDLYDVTVRSYHEWSREEAMLRALAYGQNADVTAQFFEHPGPFLELRLLSRSIHPDAPIGWDHIFVLRLIDEAVLAAPPGEVRFDWKKTPLGLHVDGFWSMDPKVDPHNHRLPVLIVEVNVSQKGKPGRSYNPIGDSADVVAIVPKEFAPNIAKVGSFESRAWGGPTWRICETYPQIKPKRLVHFKPLLRSSWTHKSKVVKFGEKGSEKAPSQKLEGHCRAIVPRAEGGSWLLTDEALYEVSADGQLTSGTALSTWVNVSKGVGLALAGSKDLWIATNYEVIVRGSSGHMDVRRNVGGIKTPKCIAAAPDGRIVLGGKEGVAIVAPDGTTTTYTKDLGDKHTCRVAVAEDGTIWASGFNRNLTRIRPDGTVTVFGSRQGIETIVDPIPLPDGGVWVSPRFTVLRISASAPGATPCPLGGMLAPTGIQAFVQQGDTLWLATKEDNLVALTEGKPPTCFVFANTDEKLGKTTQSPIGFCFTSEGNLHWITDEGLFVVSKEQLERAQNAPSLVADALDAAQVPAISWKASTEPKKGIDFRGKVVVLTGTLATMTRSDAQKVLVDRGAVLSDSVSKATHYLIAGAKAGSKLKKAESLGIPVLPEEVLLTPPPSNEAEASKPAEPASVELSAADKVRLFPLSDQPRQGSRLDHTMMRQLAASGEALTEKQWKSIVTKHRAFLKDGELGSGEWQTLDVSGLVMAILPGASKGQADIARKKLAPGFKVGKADLRWINGCATLAEGVDFSTADLSNGIFTDSFLAGASFEGAKVASVDFSRANLENVNFRNANCSRADFENANLTGADFTGAKLEGARFPGAILDKVKI